MHFQLYAVCVSSTRGCQMAFWIFYTYFPSNFYHRQLVCRWKIIFRALNQPTPHTSEREMLENCWTTTRRRHEELNEILCRWKVATMRSWSHDFTLMRICSLGNKTTCSHDKVRTFTSWRPRDYLNFSNNLQHHTWRWAARGVASFEYANNYIQRTNYAALTCQTTHIWWCATILTIWKLFPAIFQAARWYDESQKNFHVCFLLCLLENFLILNSFSSSLAHFRCCANCVDIKMSRERHAIWAVGLRDNQHHISHLKMFLSLPFHVSVTRWRFSSFNPKKSNSKVRTEREKLPHQSNSLKSLLTLI